MEGKSNYLVFNIFQSDSLEINSNNKELNAFVNISFDIYYNFNYYTVGFFQQLIAQSFVNGGLNQLWYSVNKDFFTLLNNKNINDDLESSPLQGRLTQNNSYGIYIQRKFKLNRAHFFSIKSKLSYATELNHINIEGITDSKNFEASLDYWYSYANLVTRDTVDNHNAYALGYALDLEYIYNNDNIYFYLAVLNLYSYSYWKHISYMHYDFNNEVVYKGDDGYNHYRSFGIGYYKYNINFKQKTPQYYKASVNYEYKSFSFGDNFEVYKYLNSNEIYMSYRYLTGRYKLGYVLEYKTFIFATYFENFIFEITDTFEDKHNIFQGNLKISF